MSVCSYKKQIKYVASLILVAFLVQDVAWASPDPGVFQRLHAPAVIAHPITQSDLLKDPSLLRVPFESSMVKEIHHGSNGKLLIHIQDAHANFSGQLNLAKTLETLSRAYNINLILGEGSEGDMTLDRLKTVADKKTWKIAAKRFLQDGVIVGEEYLNLTSDLPLKIIGVEDQRLYDKSLEVYSKLTQNRQEVLTYLHTIRISLDRLKNRLYPKDLLTYEQHKKDALEDPSKRLDLLEPLAQSQKIDWSNYPEAHKLLKLKSQEKTISFQSITHEQENLLSALRLKGKGQELGKLLEAMKKASDLAQTQLWEELFKMAEDSGVTLESYPHLSGYRKFLESFTSIDLERSQDEIELLEDEIYRQKLPEESSRRLKAIERFLELLDRAYKIQMSSKDFKALILNRKDFPTVPWQAFLNDELSKLNYFDDLIPYKTILSKALKPLFDFYDLVDQRDKAFLQRTTSALNDSGQKTAFLITGGYHTSHLTELLRQEDFSYVVLTPIVQTETDLAKYERILLAPLTVKHATINPNQPSQAPDAVDTLRGKYLADIGGARLEIYRDNPPDRLNIEAVSRLLSQLRGARMSGRTLPDGLPKAPRLIDLRDLNILREDRNFADERFDYKSNIVTAEWNGKKVYVKAEPIRLSRYVLRDQKDAIKDSLVLREAWLIARMGKNPELREYLPDFVGVNMVTGEDARAARNIRSNGRVAFAEGQAYLVLKAVEGQTLHGMLIRSRATRDPKVNYKQIARVFYAVDRMIRAFNRNGYFIRDLSESDVFVLPDGRVKLIDYDLSVTEGDDSEFGINDLARFSTESQDILLLGNDQTGYQRHNSRLRDRLFVPMVIRDYVNGLWWSQGNRSTIDYVGFVAREIFGPAVDLAADLEPSEERVRAFLDQDPTTPLSYFVSYVTQRFASEVYATSGTASDKVWFDLLGRAYLDTDTWDTGVEGKPSNNPDLRTLLRQALPREEQQDLASTQYSNIRYIRTLVLMLIISGRADILAKIADLDWNAFVEYRKKINTYTTQILAADRTAYINAETFDPTRVLGNSYPRGQDPSPQTPTGARMAEAPVTFVEGARDFKTIADQAVAVFRGQTILPDGDIPIDREMLAADLAIQALEWAVFKNKALDLKADYDLAPLIKILTAAEARHPGAFGALPGLINTLNALKEPRLTRSKRSLLRPALEALRIARERVEIAIRIVRHEGGAYDLLENVNSVYLSVEDPADLLKITESVHRTQARMSARKAKSYPRQAPIVSYSEAALWRSLVEAEIRTERKAKSGHPSQGRVNGKLKILRFDLRMFFWPIVSGEPIREEVRISDPAWIQGIKKSAIRSVGEDLSEHVTIQVEQGSMLWADGPMVRRAIEVMLKNSLLVAKERLDDENEKRKGDHKRLLTWADRPVKLTVKVTRDPHGASVIDVVELNDNVGGVTDPEALKETYPGSGRQKIMALNFSRRKKDTGFGLAFVWHVVQMHGGSFEIRNLNGRPGTGIHVVIRLPAKPTHANAAAPNAITGPPAQSAARMAASGIKMRTSFDRGVEYLEALMARRDRIASDITRAYLFRNRWVDVLSTDAQLTAAQWRGIQKEIMRQGKQAKINPLILGLWDKHLTEYYPVPSMKWYFSDYLIGSLTGIKYDPRALLYPIKKYSEVEGDLADYKAIKLWSVNAQSGQAANVNRAVKVFLDGYIFNLMIRLIISAQKLEANGKITAGPGRNAVVRMKDLRTKYRSMRHPFAYSPTAVFESRLDMDEPGLVKRQLKRVGIPGGWRKPTPRQLRYAMQMVIGTGRHLRSLVAGGSNQEWIDKTRNINSVDLTLLAGHLTVLLHKYKSVMQDPKRIALKNQLVEAIYAALSADPNGLDPEVLFDRRRFKWHKRDAESAGTSTFYPKIRATPRKNLPPSIRRTYTRLMHELSESLIGEFDRNSAIQAVLRDADENPDIGAGHFGSSAIFGKDLMSALTALYLIDGIRVSYSDFHSLLSGQSPEKIRKKLDISARIQIYLLQINAAVGYSGIRARSAHRTLKAVLQKIAARPPLTRSRGARMAKSDLDFGRALTHFLKKRAIFQPMDSSLDTYLSENPSKFKQLIFKAHELDRQVQTTLREAYKVLERRNTRFRYDDVIYYFQDEDHEVVRLGHAGPKRAIMFNLARWKDMDVSAYRPLILSATFHEAGHHVLNLMLHTQDKRQQAMTFTRGVESSLVKGVKFDFGNIESYAPDHVDAVHEIFANWFSSQMMNRSDYINALELTVGFIFDSSLRFSDRKLSTINLAQFVALAEHFDFSSENIRRARSMLTASDVTFLAQLKAFFADLELHGARMAGAGAKVAQPTTFGARMSVAPFAGARLVSLPMVGAVGARYAVPPTGLANIPMVEVSTAPFSVGTIDLSQPFSMADEIEAIQDLAHSKAIGDLQGKTFVLPLGEALYKEMIKAVPDINRTLQKMGIKELVVMPLAQYREGRGISAGSLLINLVDAEHPEEAVSGASVLAVSAKDRLAEFSFPQTLSVLVLMGLAVTKGKPGDFIDGFGSAANQLGLRGINRENIRDIPALQEYNPNFEPILLRQTIRRIYPTIAMALAAARMAVKTVFTSA